MDKLIAYIGNDPDRLECALHPARRALAVRAGTPLGVGLGFVQNGEVLLQKRPRAAATEIDVFQLARTVRADALVAHVAEDAARPTEDGAPYRFRWWLYAQAGTADGFDQVRERLLGSIPDFLRRNIRGTSAKEHVFHLFLAFLHDAGLLEHPTPPPEAVRRALHESVAFLDRLLASAGAACSRLCTVVTNGRCLAASTRGTPMQLLEIAGVADCTVCRADVETASQGRRVAHETLRAIVLEAGWPETPQASWRQVPPATSLVVGPDLAPLVQ